MSSSNKTTQDSLSDINLNNDKPNSKPKPKDKDKDKDIPAEIEPEIDYYEPQHQYHEPSDDIMRQLNVQTETESETPDEIYSRHIPSSPSSRERRSVAQSSAKGMYRGTMIKQRLSSVKKVAMKVLGHMRRGEMPWTQWDCCGGGGRDGVKCGTVMSRLHGRCKKCRHERCGRCEVMSV